MTVSRDARIICLTLLLALGLLSCADNESPTEPRPFDAELLYEGYLAGVPETFRLDTANGTPIRIFPAGTRAMDPTPSPDGSRIIFVDANYVDGTGDILIANGDGTGIRPLTTGSALDDSPAWSPNGQRLAYRSYEAGYEGDIWVMNADGTNARNLTPTVGTAIVDNRRPSWSPDGQKLVFASTRGGDWGIWVMNADGSDPRQLTNTMDLDAEPVWSPDGAWIAFRRTDASGSDIMVLAAAGGEPRRIAMAGEQRLPAWSPDGRWIAFVGSPTISAQPEIFIMRQDGGGVRLVTTDPGWGGGVHPVWRRRN